MGYFYLLSKHRSSLPFNIRNLLCWLIIIPLLTKQGKIIPQIFVIKLLNRNWLTSQWLHKYLLQLILRNKITQSFFSFLMSLQNVSEKNIKINRCITIYSVPSHQLYVYSNIWDDIVDTPKQKTVFNKTVFLTIF